MSLINQITSFWVFVFVFCACVSDHQKVLDPFSTVDAEELFFKNIRQSDYKTQEIQVAGLNIFTHKEADEKDELAVKLVQNWREDKAYVMVETSLFEAPFTLYNVAAADSVLFTGESLDNHLACFEFICASISDEKTLFWDANRTDEVAVPQYFIVVFKDFKKLTSRK